MLVLIVIAAACGAVLAWCERRFTVRENPFAEAIDRLLPQTQCTQCGFPGCKPYAQAIACGESDINRCLPGGDVVVARIAELVGTRPLPLMGEKNPETERVARIDEAECIGCTLCLKACPVDAILGAPKLMHTVIDDRCTGCELCIAPCPVDCITMHPLPSSWIRPETAGTLA